MGANQQSPVWSLRGPHVVPAWSLHGPFTPVQLQGVRVGGAQLAGPWE